jgi:hypothetical protein
MKELSICPMKDEIEQTDVNMDNFFFMASFGQHRTPTVFL